VVKTKGSHPAAFLSFSSSQLRRVNGVGGTHINAGTAIDAFVLIDDHVAVDLGDRAFRAFAFAGTAVDAGIGINFMSHELSFLWYSEFLKIFYSSNSSSRSVSQQDKACQ